ncbi:MAG TPA: DivIVA domain-containing protein [Acidimicrobiales bacterium]|nr:DivIVA domain-containing protein [Acidimicrobiales bacterium]
MELTPQTLHAVEFREARRGGYNTRDVDDFLERIAQGVGLLQDRLREVMARAESAEGRLSDTQRQLEELRRRPVAPEMSETDDTLRRTLVLAQRTADATIKEAKDEAARILGDARDEAARTRAEIEAEVRRGTEGARAQAEAEIEQLLDAREALNRDIEALGQRMSDQRERVRSGIAELERVLDDPSLLQSVPAVPLTEVERPNRLARPEPPGSVPGPVLPTRQAPGEPEPVNGQGAPDAAVPFLPGAQVASLHDNPPPLPARPLAAEAGSAVPVSPFAFNGGANAVANGISGNGHPEPAGPAHWPSQLRTSLSDDDGPEGGDRIGIEPGSRPSEWGRNVFDRDDEDDRSRFGR